MSKRSGSRRSIVATDGQSDATRKELAMEIARHFKRHLRGELSKSQAQLETVTRDGRTFQVCTEDLLDRLHSEFPELAELPLPETNMIESLWDRMRTPVKYADTTFRAFNDSFHYRLLHLRDGSRASRRGLVEAMTEMFRVARFARGLFSYRQTYFFELHLYEELRQIVQAMDIDVNSAWQCMVDLHQIVNGVAVDFFDQVIADSLEKSDQLLGNILPRDVAQELKYTGEVIPFQRTNVTVLFTDIVGFVRLSEQLSPEEILRELDLCFSHFDSICKQHQIEKIKTIGDSYMCAGGLFSATPAADVALAALKMREFMRKYRKSRQRRGLPEWDLRIGMHTGPVIAGIIGKTRLTFDIWGDTVNTASRMEASSEPGQINLSAATRELLDPYFLTRPRGRLPVKHKEDQEMFFLESIRPEFSLLGRGRVASEALRKVLTEERKKQR